MCMEYPLFHGRPSDGSGRLRKEMESYDLLDSLRVDYQRLDHPPAMTMEICAQIEKSLRAAICKNLFLCNRQETDFYLLMMPAGKPFRTKNLSAQLSCSRLSFGKEEDLLSLLDLTPGSVSVLALRNDRENRVRLLFDRDLLSQEWIGCHPCMNTSSLRLKTEDLLSVVLPAMGHEPVFVTL